MALILNYDFHLIFFFRKGNNMQTKVDDDDDDDDRYLSIRSPVLVRCDTNCQNVQHKFQITQSHIPDYHCC